MSEKGAPADGRIGEIAGRQHGVVSIGQLHAAGLSDDAVLTRTRSGRLHRIHRGVYLVGHPGLTAERRWMAATLAFPEAGVLSHRCAAALWGLLPARGGGVDITLPSRGGRRRRAGIRLHRSSTLTPEAMTRHQGIPVTTPARTISDLRRIVSAAELRRAVRQAEVLGLQVGDGVEPDGTRSELERLFLGLCRRHGLPRPEVNASVAGLTVDFLWKEQRLIVETDGYRYHRGRAAFEEDRARDLRLRMRGFNVIRLSYRQVVEESDEVVGLLRDRTSWR